MTRRRSSTEIGRLRELTRPGHLGNGQGQAAGQRMMYRLIIEPEAEVDLAEAYRWYKDQRPGLGQTFLARVEEVFARVCHMPELHAETYRNVRQTLLKRFPYVVCYTVEAASVHIIAVFHGQRDSGTWKSRTK